MGDMGMLKGMLFCADCGSKMYLVRCQGWEHSKEYFTCATYRKQRGCSSHQIRAVAVEKALLEQLQYIIRFARDDEAEFVKLVMKKAHKDRREELCSRQKEFEQAKSRISQLDSIIQRLYEDNVSGKISDERFNKLFATYEAEQKELVLRIAELGAYLAAEQEKATNIGAFLQLVKRYADLKELDAEVIRLFVERIDVAQTNACGRYKIQHIQITYNLIGSFESPEKDGEEYFDGEVEETA